MSRYKRQFGDNLCSTNKRLKLNWRWLRIASMCSEEEIKKWTHFQCSISNLDHRELEATQWHSDENVNYEATIAYRGSRVSDSPNHKTRLEAQIAAEALLLKWIREQNKMIEQATGE